MTFISYAQNFEDVMLWRALKHVDSGFYIDVGAWSPDLDSVTRAFYERGWRGINIEPNLEFHRQLELRRPRDQNLQLAISDCEGNLPMNFISSPGLSTLDASIAAQHQEAGWSISRELVTVTTLTAIWQQHVPSDQDVHFLKIDVEGLEEAVLRGLDWAKHRPWIVIVESTLPMSQIESHQAWEPILSDAGYSFAYADGLNRFYVSPEHSELLGKLKHPPNVFDDFKLMAVATAEARATEAEARATEAEARVSELEGHVDHWRKRASGLAAERDALRGSWSWRITGPLRFALDLLARPGQTLRGGANHIIRRSIDTFQRPLSGFMAAVLRRQEFSDRVNHWLLARFPAMHGQLRDVAVRSGIKKAPAVSMPSSTGNSIAGSHERSTLSDLTPHARRIHAELAAAIKKNQRKN